jgi:hypothetical protein
MDLEREYRLIVTPGDEVVVSTRENGVQWRLSLPRRAWG